MSVALTGLPDEDDGDDGDVVVLPGDTPLLRPGTLARLVRLHRAQDDAATLLTAVLDDPHRLRPGGARARRRGGPGGRARRRHRRRARGPRGQHVDVLLQAQRAGSVAAPAQPVQRPGRVLPDRRGRGPLRGRPPGRVGGGRGHHGGGRGQRPGPAGGGRGRAARPDQRALDAPGRDHVGPPDHLHRHRGARWPPTWCCCPGSSCRGPAWSASTPRSDRTPGWSTPRSGRVRWSPPASADGRSSAPTPASGPFAVLAEGTEVPAGGVVGPAASDPGAASR